MTLTPHPASGVLGRWRLHVKRFGRNAVVVLPRIGNKRPQATIYVCPSSVLVGVAVFVNDDGEREVHVGLGFVLVEVTFWTWTSPDGLLSSDDSEVGDA